MKRKTRKQISTREMSKLKVKRVAAYVMDNVISFLMFQLVISILFVCLRTTSASILIENENVFIPINLLSIVFIFLYYRYFWINSKYHATPGQIAWNLKVSTKPNSKQLIKRIMLMHVASLYLAAAVIYMQISNMEQGIADKFLLIALSSAIVMQLTYAYFINGVDKVTGIKVVDR
jgi:uncharacterized RDD family membrane protein YckC